MKNKVIAIDKAHLKQIISAEMMIGGISCDLNHINVTGVTDMSWLFSESRFNGNIDKWDVSVVTNMESMFYRASFNQDISSWSVHNVEDMEYMFFASKFNQDLSGWDVSSVTHMGSMFYGAAFNKDISLWDVSNVLDMEYIFYKSKFNQDISNWEPRKLIHRENIFNTSQLKYRNKLPYWVTVDMKFLEQAINAYQLQKKIAKITRISSQQKQVRSAVKKI